MTEEQLSRFFRAHNLPIKHEMAEFLVREFSRVESYSMQPRRPWEPKHRYMLVFDEAALALTYLASFKK